ncbi:MAG: class II aldolase/adducin family protein [Gemmatimonadota bacterium]|nr:class II aldolase/adducin family protein [Gemmatimonadota bacterium]
MSVRVASGRILVTPAGAAKADIRPSDVVVVDEDGRRRGAGRPSTELAMHLRIYRRRADIHAVVHAHPPVATGLAVAGETFGAPVLPEVVLGLGPVALVPYATPGTEAVADRLEAVVGVTTSSCFRTTARRPSARRWRLPTTEWRVWSIARGSCSPRDCSGGSVR